MITVENLSKSYPTEAPGSAVVALEDVSIQVPAGAIHAVVGPASSGKSALSRCLSLVDKPDSGTILMNDTDLTALDGKTLRVARRQIGVVAQAQDADSEHTALAGSLQRQRTTAGNVALPLEASNMSASQRRSRVAELLDLVGLTDKAPIYPDHLTDGQRQRVAVARALADQPAVLVVDDPTAGLDAAATDALLTVLDRARSELGVTIVITTTDMAAVRRIADEVTVLDSGKVAEQGKVLDLVASPSSRVSTQLLGDSDQRSLAASAGPDYDVVAEIVLVGFAAVGALLPEASNRFDVQLSILGGEQTRLGETPVSKFQVGLSGQRSESALKWMIEQDAQVRRAPVCVEAKAA